MAMFKSQSESGKPDKDQQGTAQQWERELLTRLASASLQEQRRARRWGIFFKLALLVYLIALLVVYLPADFATPGVSKKHTALVEIAGVIAEDSDFSADQVISGLRAAFEDDGTVGVILRINSPGGSPVQAGYINDEVSRLREKYPEIPVYSVITDMCASGGYYVAAAADKIYADKSSIVGSIGVLMNAFGFVEAMDRLGIERRLLTAGEHKGLLDPFSPVKEEELTHVQELLDEMHQQFIEVVKRGRKGRLKGGEKLFTGLIWSGEKSVELGLVDALGSSGYVAREVIGEEDIVDFTPTRSYLDRFADRIGVAMARAVTRDFFGEGLQLE